MLLHSSLHYCLVHILLATSVWSSKPYQLLTSWRCGGPWPPIADDLDTCPTYWQSQPICRRLIIADRRTVICSICWRRPRTTADWPLNSNIYTIATTVSGVALLWRQVTSLTGFGDDNSLTTGNLWTSVTISGWIGGRGDPAGSQIRHLLFEIHYL